MTTTMDRLREHYEEAKTLFPEEKIIGVFLRGSQNYELDYNDSDVDSVCVITPSLNDFVLSKKMVSRTHERENKEHIELKDVRLIAQAFMKQNSAWLEILFTKYKIINPTYEHLWNMWIKERESIARLNPYKAVSTMKGIASDKHHALEHRYPNKVEVLEKFGGYDPKQLSHLLRVKDLLTRYVNNELYAQCLIPKEKTQILNVKVYGVESLEKARELNESVFEEICQMADDFRQKTPNAVNVETENKLNGVLCEIVKIALKKELEEDL